MFLTDRFDLWSNLSSKKMEKRKISYDFPIEHRLGLNIVLGPVTVVDLSSLEANLLSW